MTKILRNLYVFDDDDQNPYELIRFLAMMIRIPMNSWFCLEILALLRACLGHHFPSWSHKNEHFVEAKCTFLNKALSFVYKS